MKRLLLLLLVVPLFGFTLYDFSYQTARVRWETLCLDDCFPGQPLTNTFNASTSPGEAVAYGGARWRMAGIECTVWAAGATPTDGGTNFVAVRVTHEDAGVDCQCILGAICGGGIGRCDCPTGMTELGGTKFSMTPVSPTTIDGGAAYCWSDPTQIHCSVDLFR